MGSKTKIDWADATWNPVTGCEHGCPYCYARGIAERFGTNWLPDENPDTYKCVLDGTETHAIIEFDGMQARERKDGKIVPAPYPLGFTPTLHRYRLDEPRHWKKPRTIFVCSMADLFGDWVPDGWIREVFEACEAAPQHRYIFLTKNPARLCKMASACRLEQWNKKHDRPHPRTKEFAGTMPLPMHDNWWFGSTLDNANATRFDGRFRWNTFTNIEPLMEYMNVGLGSFGGDKWVIIGAETGNRKGKVIPKREWVENILNAARITRMKVFMKESLRDLMGDDFRQEFPWEV